MRAYAYVWVSKLGEASISSEIQRDELTRFANQKDWTITGWYEDLDLSGRACIATATNVRNVKVAARVYASKAKLGADSENYACAVKIRALKRMAELVGEGQERGQIAEMCGVHVDTVLAHRPDVSETDTSPSTVTDLGIKARRRQRPLGRPGAGGEVVTYQPPSTDAVYRPSEGWYLMAGIDLMEGWYLMEG